MNEILATIKDRKLTFEQKVIKLSRQAEETLNV